MSKQDRTRIRPVRVTCGGCGFPIRNAHPGQQFHNHACAARSELLLAYYPGQPLSGKKAGKGWRYA
jgi:hypothetical protein